MDNGRLHKEMKELQEAAKNVRKLTLNYFNTYSHKDCLLIITYIGNWPHCASSVGRRQY